MHDVNYDPSRAHREAALANRAAAFALLAALLTVIALVAIPVTFRETDRADLRALSAAPLAGAAASAFRAYSTRRRLEAIRGPDRGLSADAARTPADTEPPAAA